MKKYHDNKYFISLRPSESEKISLIHNKKETIQISQNLFDPFDSKKYLLLNESVIIIISKDIIYSLVCFQYYRIIESLDSLFF